MNVRILMLERVGNFFGRLFRRCKAAVENAHHKDFREATRRLADRANSSIKKEQDELGDKIVLYLARRFKKVSYDFVSVYPLRDNGSTYTIFVSVKKDEFMKETIETDEVIIHINLHQVPYPIMVRGLYAGGMWREEEYFAKDPVSVALLVTKVFRRIKADGYLIKPPKQTRNPIDFVSLALSN